MEGLYTRFFACQGESTLSFALILRTFFDRTVENFRSRLWIFLWKTSEVFSIQNFRISGDFDETRCRLCKTMKIVDKKDFSSRKKLHLRLKSFKIRLKNEKRCRHCAFNHSVGIFPIFNIFRRGKLLRPINSTPRPPFLSVRVPPRLRCKR